MFELSISAVIYIVLGSMVAGMIIYRLVKYLIAKATFMPPCMINAKVRYMRNHEIKISVLNKGNNPDESDMLFKQDADPYSTAEADAKIDNINNKTIRFQSIYQGRTVVEKILAVSVKSRQFYSDDFVNIDITGKETGTTGSYHSMVPEQRPSAMKLQD